MPKHKMLDFLFKVVNGESSYTRKHKKRSQTLSRTQLNFRPLPKDRKNDSSSLLPVTASTPALTGVSALKNNAHFAKTQLVGLFLTQKINFANVAHAVFVSSMMTIRTLPSGLWLFSNSDQPLQEDSCGFSCHLECALEDERSGIQQSGQSKKLDGDYCFTQCGKQMDLLRCWKKQLLVAKNARRLDVLCHRIFLSHKILISTKKYLVLHKIVDTAMKKLDVEVGPITGIQDMGHGLVGRLAVGVEVQKLCICAIEALQSLFSGSLTADLQIQRPCITHCREPTSKSQKLILVMFRKLKFMVRRNLLGSQQQLLMKSIK